MLSSIIGTSVRLRLLVALAAAVLLVAGGAQMRTAPVDVLPEFSGPTVQVETESLGLSANEVEQLITDPMETDLLNGVQGAETIRSESVPGLSSIELTFTRGTDILTARQLVQERLTQISVLPNVLTTPPTMRQAVSSTNRVLAVGLSSARLTPIQLSVLARWTVRPRLLGLPGVANVAIWGQRDRQLQVRVDPKRLHAHGVSLAQIISTVGNAQLVSPLSYLNASSPGTGGFVDGPNQRLAIRHVLPFGAPAKLAQVPVDGSGGRRLRIGAVARVVAGHPPLIGDAVVHGGRGLLLVVEKLPGASAVGVTNAVERAIRELRPGLPGVRADTTLFRPATYIASARHNLRLVLIAAAVLLVLVAALFLLSLRAVLVSAVAVALSLLAALVVLYLTGATINAMVAAGLLLALTIVVDDAVGDSQSIHRRLGTRRRGEGLAHAVSDATVQLRRPLVFATLIVLLAVTPLFVAQGVTAAFVRPMALGYVCAVLASMVVALTASPALRVLVAARGAPAARAGATRRRVADAHGRLLGWMMQMPRATLLAVCAAGLLGLAAVPWLREPGRPSFKDRNVLVRWTASPGTSLGEMDRIATRVTRDLRALPGVHDAAADLGRAVTGDRVVGTGSGELWVTMDPGADYDRTLSAIGNVAHGVPGVDGDLGTYETDRTSAVLARPPRAVTVRVYGEDYALLGRKAGQVKASMTRVPGVRDPEVERPTLEPAIEVEVKLQAALRHGLKPGDVRRAAGTLLSGLTVGDFFEQQKVFEVVVQGSQAGHASLDQVRALPIDTPGGGQVPLGAVARVRLHAVPADIRHDAVSRYIDVRAAVSGRGVDAVRSDVQRRVSRLSFPLEYHAEVLGRAGGATPHSRFVSFVLAAAIGVLLLMQAALRSWRLALLLLSMLPLAVAGGVLVAVAAGSQHSLGAYAGLLAIFGLAARHGIVLLTRIEQLAETEGSSSSMVAAKRAARERLAPTLASGCTIAAALLPFLILGDEPGNEITHEMAAVILGGVATSSLVTLLVLPAAYIHMERRRIPAAAALAVLLSLLSGCADASEPKPAPPAKVERGGGAPRVVLTASGARRLGIRTGCVRRAGPHRRTIPYAAVLYEPGGTAVTYASPAPLHYVRRRIVIRRIAGSSALLVKGPPAGTAVVTVGADELLGAEQGVAGEG